MKETWFVMDTRDMQVLSDPDVLFGAIVYLSKDRQVNTRSIYSVLDWLGDVGGLFDALMYLGHMTMFIYFKFIGGDPIYDFLSRTLFKRESRTARHESGTLEAIDRLKSRKRLRVSTFMCCRRSKERRVLERAKGRIDAELNLEALFSM